MSSFTESFSGKDSPCLTRETAWSRTYRDLQATAMSIDWSGQWILLAGRFVWLLHFLSIIISSTRFLFRRHLALQKLDIDQTEDENFLRKFHRNSKHEVSAAEWAICQDSQEYCAIATSQLIEVVTWRSGDPTLIHSLRAHTRVITDIDWHSKTPYLLASCSIDTFTHLWDLRDPKKPTMSLSAVCMCKIRLVKFILFLEKLIFWFTSLQPEQLKSVSIECREICWRPRTMATWEFGMYEKAHVQFNTSQLIWLEFTASIGVTSKKLISLQPVKMERWNILT